MEMKTEMFCAMLSNERYCRKQSTARDQALIANWTAAAAAAVLEIN